MHLLRRVTPCFMIRAQTQGGSMRTEKFERLDRSNRTLQTGLRAGFGFAS